MQRRYWSHWLGRHGKRLPRPSFKGEKEKHISTVCSKGQNLILNMNDKGFTVVAYNRTTSKVDHFLENEAKGSSGARHS
jgi:hypothetical protein